MTTGVSIVIPTVGRPSLGRLLDSLAGSEGPEPARIVVVDDRPHPHPPLELEASAGATEIYVLTSGGRGPAAARNVGWRECHSTWIAFLDDDVLVSPTWLRDLAADLEDSAEDVAGSQGRVEVPLPEDRRPTDWERGTAGLMHAAWITADMAYRREALEAVGGFDERFPRAFREDADLALRVQQAGWQLVRGRRGITHPVRPAGWDASLRQQRGNADDALMRRRHGPDWYRAAQAARGRRNAHLATVAAAGVGVAGAAGRQRRLATLALTAWAVLTAQFAAARIAPGPRTPGEIARMVATSVLIPPAATWHWLAGLLRHRDAPAWPLPTKPVTP
jgi:glycosyltransferase involved in cell wall biosynthesis